MARPTKYKKEFIQELLDYLDVKPYEEITKKIVKDGQEIEITEKIVADYPSLAGFAVKIGVCRDTITEWAKIYPEFSGACKRLNVVQENYLIVNGLKGNIQQNFGMFVAKNNIGYRDKQPGEEDKQITINDISKKSDEELDEQIKKLSGEIDE